MTTDPIDLVAARRPAAPRGPLKPNAALDEAFAAVTDLDLRRDQPTSAAPAETAGLATVLRDQTAALDAHRRELSRLLNGLG